MVRYLDHVDNDGMEANDENTITTTISKKVSSHTHKYTKNRFEAFLCVRESLIESQSLS